MRKLVMVVSIVCMCIPYHAYGDSFRAIVCMPYHAYGGKKARLGLGLDVADTTMAFFERDGIHIPVSMAVSYDVTKHFQAYTSQILRFPVRGGYMYIPSLGLRVHSQSIHGLTFFLGTSIGYTLTNVPWFTKGFILQSHVGSRYIFRFKMYIEGGIGGAFPISAEKIRPSYFLILGYML